MSIKQRRKQHGGGLMEILITMAIAGVILGGALTLFTSSNRQIARMFHYYDIGASSAVAMDTISRDIRDANRVTAATANSLEIEEAGGLRVTYTFSPVEGTLARTRAGQSRVLLRGCDSLTFTLGKRNPSGAFAIFPAATPTECKVVTITWKCSRALLGRKEVSESVTTANVVIRRQGA